jgi:hypothetical protein
VEYRFFLFDDLLVYGHRTSGGMVRLHKRLPLAHLAVERGLDAKGLKVGHPLKKLELVAPTPRDREAWLRAIQGAQGAV